MDGVGSPRFQKSGSTTSPRIRENNVSVVSTTSKSSKASKFDEPRATTLNYEYKEQPTVKANLTASELKFLDGDTTTGSSTGTISSMRSVVKPDRNANRFAASVLVMFTFGCFNVIVSSFYAYPSCQFLCTIFIVINTFTTFEWHRIHGVTLTRRLRPVLNIKSVYATYRNLDPDSACLYAADKDKFLSFACCNVPEINNELPRTSDEKSPPSSPPNDITVSPTTTAKTDSSAASNTNSTPSPLNPDLIKRSTEVNFQFPDSSAKEF